MNCRRVEKLIPLYVEGDLSSGAAERLASHLEWCGRCNFLADEYKDSQTWLRSSEPAAFDEASLDGLKAGVLRRLAESNAKPSLLASLMQQWSRRQVLALSAAMLIVFGVVVFYIYRAGANVKREVIEAVNHDHESQPSTSPDTGRAPGADLKGTPHRHISRRASRSTAPMMIEPKLTTPTLSQKNPMENTRAAIANPSDPFADLSDDPREMLRIEIQTGDPNIRIIWFAPKEVEVPKTN